MSGWGLPAGFESVDAAAGIRRNETDYIYFFAGDKYTRFEMDNNTISPGYEDGRPIAVWTGLPEDGNFSSAYSVDFGPGMVFFRGDQFWEYDMDRSNVAEGFPKPIEGNWLTHQSSTTASLYSASPMGSEFDLVSVYHFGGPNYQRYSMNFGCRAK